MRTYKGTVDIGNKAINWQTTFEQSVKFRCIRCGLSCIGADVQLTEKEIKLIQEKIKEDFYEEYTTPFGNKRKRLRKSGKRCIFLDDKMNCRIYPIRPLLCREYPFKVLFTNKNNAVIDITSHCGCIITKDFDNENKVDFGEIVKEHYINSPEDADELELLDDIVQDVKKNMDSHEAVKRCWDIIVGRLVSPLETCSLIVNFQHEREKFRTLGFSNLDRYISSTLERDYLETDWTGFMQRFHQKIAFQKNNLTGMEIKNLRKYSLTISQREIEFNYLFSNDRVSISPESLQRKAITPDGIDELKGFLNKFWDRAVTSYDFYLAMRDLRERIGKYPPSIIIQLDAGRFALHCFEYFLHVLSEKNRHEDITDEDVKETILILDGAFLTVTSGIIPKQT